MKKKITMDFVRWGAMSPQKHKEARQPEKCTTSMFHVAPTVWGIYAFPRGFVFDWLLGMSESDMRQTNRFRWVKDAKGHRVTLHDVADPDYHKYEQNINRLSRLNHMDRNGGWTLGGRELNSCYYWDGPANKFKYGGDIWHHLEFFHYKYNDAKYGYYPDAKNVYYRDFKHGYFQEEDEHLVSKKVRIVPMQAIKERSGSWVKTSIRDYRKALRKFNDCRKRFEAMGKDTQRKNICYIAAPEGCRDIRAQMEVFIERV